MTIIDQAKNLLERASGIGRPKRSELRALVCPTTPHAFRFKDDGRTPNNPDLPLLIYRKALIFPSDLDPAAVAEEVFALNGWRRSWRDSIYPFLHFHTRTHEVLGIARGSARVQFGGSSGRTFALAEGDVIAIPAGTGHRCMSKDRTLLVVGAYPARGHYDEPRPSEADHAAAKASIARVPLPAKDPLFGRNGPLRDQWHSRSKG